MRCFDVSVDEEERKVLCDPETMHVSPHIHEVIAVRLVETEWGKYDLDLSIDEDPANALKKGKLTRSVTVLDDTNSAPSEAKISISLTAIDGAGGIANLADLDPRIVNE